MVLDKLPPNASLRLKLAALFHDLGKADTQAKNKEGKITFYGHSQKSAEHTKQIASRLRLPKKLSEEVVWLVKNHMLPLTVDTQAIRTTKLEKMFFQNEKLGQDLIALAQADALSSLPAKGEPNLENINRLISRLQEIESRLDAKSKINIPRLITGKDLIALGLEPGPVFKEILDEIRVAQLDGRIVNKEEAIELAKGIINKRHD
jgi:poly(A) polymerase